MLFWNQTIFGHFLRKAMGRYIKMKIKHGETGEYRLCVVTIACIWDFSLILCAYEVGCSLPLLCCEQSGLQKINMEKQHHCGFDPTRLVLLYTWTAQTPCYKQQGRQWQVLATIVAVEKIKNCVFWVCVCSLSYPACKSYAPHCHVICPALQHFTLSHKRQDFIQKILLCIKYVFWFSLQILYETFLILRRI